MGVPRPVVAILIEAFRGNLPGAVPTLGMAVVVAGIVIVNLPAAEARAGAGEARPSCSGASALQYH